MGKKDDGSGLGLSLSLGPGMNLSFSLKESLMQKKPSFRTLPNQRASWSDIFQLPADVTRGRSELRGENVATGSGCEFSLLRHPPHNAFLMCSVSVDEIGGNGSLKNIRRRDEKDEKGKLCTMSPRRGQHFPLGLIHPHLFLSYRVQVGLTGEFPAGYNRDP